MKNFEMIQKKWHCKSTPKQFQNRQKDQATCVLYL